MGNAPAFLLASFPNLIPSTPMMVSRTIDHAPPRWGDGFVDEPLRKKITREEKKKNSRIGSSQSRSKCNSECIQAHHNTQIHVGNACHKKYYSAARNVSAGMGIGMGMGGGPCRSQLPSGSLRTSHAPFGSGS